MHPLTASFDLNHGVRKRNVIHTYNRSEYNWTLLVFKEWAMEGKTQTGYLVLADNSGYAFFVAQEWYTKLHSYRYSLAVFWKGQAHMVYINLRLNVADYDKWRAGFDANESSRKSAGSTGVNQFYRDVENPNNVTLVLEWDEAEKAQAFLNDPYTKASMDEAGVTGRPMVVAVQMKA